MNVAALGVLRVGGGTMFVFTGPPNVGVAWTLDGPGTLTPVTSHTDGAGIASARWDAGGAVAGATVTVTVTTYA